MTSPHILGIDCSTKAIHGVCLDENGDICKLYKILSGGSKDVDYNAMDMAADFESILENNGCKNMSLFIENPVYIQNVKTTNAIGNIVFAIKHIFFRMDSYFQGVAVTSWKKDILANGKADKKVIMEFAKAKWGKQITEQDFADAACIALYGLRRLGKQK